MWKKSVCLDWFLFYKYRSMRAIDVTRARQNEAKINEIAQAANNQLGSYNNLVKALQEFSKQVKENSKKTSGRNDPMTVIKTTLTTQTGILKEILKVLKSGVVTSGPGTKALSVNGQQTEMAEAVKKSNQVKGKTAGELKLAPSTVQQISAMTSKANTKAMEASTKKQAAAIRTQKIAQSFTQLPKQKEKVQTVAKSSGNILGSLTKILPKLLVGLKKILFAVFSPPAMIAMLISRFLPYVMLGIAFLYGVWQGIKDHLAEIWDDIPGIIVDGLKVAGELLWDGLVLLGRGAWACIDKIGDILAGVMFKIYEGFGEWWSQLKAVVSFGFDWIKEGVTNWCNKAVAVFQFAVDYVSGIFNGLKNSILGFFQNIGNAFTGFFTNIKDKISNSWLGKKLGLGTSSTVTNTTNTNINKSTNVNKNKDNEDAFRLMTKDITAPMNQMTRLIENQDKLLKQMNMTPVMQNASFNTNMTPVNGNNITIMPNDNIASNLVRQTTNITNMQTANNKELANAFTEGIGRVVDTLNENYEASMMDRLPPVTSEG